LKRLLKLASLMFFVCAFSGCVNETSVSDESLELRVANQARAIAVLTSENDQLNKRIKVLEIENQTLKKGKTSK
jgi:cell division protein FtsB